MNPRYQIFVSSTYTDLIEERHAVREAILELAHFPAGMELFPATDATPWELIEQIIKESDYYVVVIGGRYGSVDEKGISFTEREYDLAEEIGKPILAFLHRDPDLIPAGKSERSDAAQDKLQAFRQKVSRHLFKSWSTPDDLKSVVMLSLVNAIRTQPQRGWIRAGGPDVTETLARLADLQQRYDELARENAALREQAGASISENLASGEDVTDVEFIYEFDPGNRRKYTTKLSWGELFSAIAEKLMTECDRPPIKTALTDAIVSRIWQTPLSDEITKEKAPADFKEFWRRTDISNASFEAIMLQFIALGFVETSSVMRTRSTPGFGNQEFLDQVWKLTRRGVIEFLGRRAKLRS